MALYNLQNQKLQIIKEESFKLEKDIQSITEKNLEYIFGFKFIKSEFSLNNLRIDTLAFDKVFLFTLQIILVLQVIM